MNVRPTVASAPIEQAIHEVLEAQRKFWEAKVNLAEAHRGLVHEAINRGWEDCLTPRIGQIRARLRHEER